MGDRLTQLQESLDSLTEMFYTSIGILQRDAPLISTNDKPVELWKPEEIQQRKDEIASFSQQVAKDIAETAVTIKFLISQLPHLDEAELVHDVNADKTTGRIGPGRPET
jgi:hypothetical protein